MNQMQQQQQQQQPAVWLLGHPAINDYCLYSTVARLNAGYTVYSMPILLDRRSQNTV